MVIKPEIVGYSFEITEGSHVVEATEGWTFFVVIDREKTVEFFAAYNPDVGFLICADYGDTVHSTPGAIRNFREFFREYIEK